MALRLLRAALVRGREDLYGVGVKLISWWEFAILALAVWRVFHLIAEDTILDYPRRKLLRLADEWEQEGDDPGDDYKVKWGIFITCPFCLGFHLSWIAMAIYCLLFGWVGVFSFLCLSFALSAVVALIAVNLDKSEE